MSLVDIASVGQSLAGLSGREAGAALVEQVTGHGKREVEGVLLGVRSMPEDISARRLVAWAGELLDLPRSEAAGVLGVSASRVRRNDRVTTGMLDRVLTLCDTWALVSRIVGPEGAAAWFAEGHPALEGAAPIVCLATGYGQERLRNTIWSALEGAPL